MLNILLKSQTPQLQVKHTQKIKSKANGHIVTTALMFSQPKKKKLSFNMS